MEGEVTRHARAFAKNSLGAAAGAQAALVDCPADEIFCGGARGRGKTDGMLGRFALKAGRYGKECVGIFFRGSTATKSPRTRASARMSGVVACTNAGSG